MDTEKATGYEGWAILELMGHRRLAGKLTEQVVGGGSFVRIDVPGDGDEWAATQFYAGWSPLSGPALLCDCGAVRAEWTRLLAETPR